MIDRRDTTISPPTRRCSDRILTTLLAAANLTMTSAAWASAVAPTPFRPVPQKLRSGEQDAGTYTLCWLERPLGQGWLTVSGRHRDGDRVGNLTARWETHRVIDPPSANPIDLSFWVDLGDAGSLKDRRVELALDVTIAVDLPWQSLIWLKRPFPVEPHGVLSGAGFVGEIYRESNRTGGSGGTRFPVADLLAYAEGFDTLTWQVMRHVELAVPAPEFPGGHFEPLQVGEFDVGGLRDAWDYIHANRAALARERPYVTGDCIEETPEPILY